MMAQFLDHAEAENWSLDCVMQYVQTDQARVEVTIIEAGGATQFFGTHYKKKRGGLRSVPLGDGPSVSQFDNVSVPATFDRVFFDFAKTEFWAFEALADPSRAQVDFAENFAAQGRCVAVRPTATQSMSLNQSSAVIYSSGE